MAKQTPEAMWERMLTGDFPRLHGMRRIWGASVPPRCKLCNAAFRGSGGLLMRAIAYGPSPLNRRLCKCVHTRDSQAPWGYSSGRTTTGQSHGSRSGPVHTGMSFIGTIGEGDARHFTALGDTVDTAARLTDLAGAGEILISGEAVAASGLSTTELEQRTLELRGRDQSVAAWVARLQPSPSQ